MNLIGWATGLGFLGLGVGASAWFSGYRSSGLWIGVVGLILIILAGATQAQYWIWRTERIAAAPKPKFGVEYRVALSTTTLMPVIVAHVSPSKELRPVYLMAYIEIINRQNTAVMLDSYSVERGPTPNGPWTKAFTFGIGYDIFWAYDPKKAFAIDLRKCGFDVAVMGHDIPAGGHLEGWIFFREPLPHPTDQQIRITLRDDHGNSETIVAATPTATSTNAFEQGALLERLPGTYDLSGMSLRLPETKRDKH
jgi:hypothetical protein